MTPLLSLSDIAVAFGGVQAVRGVSFDIRPGEVHALVGENGAESDRDAGEPEQGSHRPVGAVNVDPRDDTLPNPAPR